MVTRPPAQRMSPRTFAGWVAAALLVAGGCQVLAPSEIPVRSQQIAGELLEDANSEAAIEVGAPRPLLDGVGWVIGIPGKFLLWDRRIDNHHISGETLAVTAEYLHQNHLPHVKVRANQYAPLEDWSRLRRNRTVAWPWRYSLGVIQLAGEAVLPGRVFGGDHFNPFTQTIHLYSDVPAVALHEAAHAKDFTRRTYQGTYAAAYLFVPLWHETIASRDVFAYLEDQGDRDRIIEANRILYPAYGTYVGNALGGYFPRYATPLYYGSVVAGHVNGRMLSRNLPNPPRIATIIDPSETPSEAGTPEQLGSRADEEPFEGGEAASGESTYEDLLDGLLES